MKHDEGSHACCNKRLLEEGGKARCCTCRPHDECEFTTTPSPDSVLGKLQDDPEYQHALKAERERLDKELPPQDWKSEIEKILLDAPAPPDFVPYVVSHISDLLVEERGKWEHNLLYHINKNVERPDSLISALGLTHNI